MDVMGIMSGYSAQALQGVQSAAQMGILSKTMNQDAQTMSGILEGIQAANPPQQAMELSVNPNVGANFDASI